MDKPAAWGQPGLSGNEASGFTAAMVRVCVFFSGSGRGRFPCASSFPSISQALQRLSGCDHMHMHTHTGLHRNGYTGGSLLRLVVFKAPCVCACVAICVWLCQLCFSLDPRLTA